MYEFDLDKIDLTLLPPEQEPERQYYFMAKCREWVREFEQEQGRCPAACIQTFGCQMNARDSEKLMGILERVGFGMAAEEHADFVLYNTCTVRENASQRVFGRLGQLNALKKKNPQMLIALCGCMMQEAHVVEKLKKSYSFVDIVFGTHNIFKLAELLYSRLEQGRLVADIWEGTSRIVEELPAQRKFPFKSGVNIMFGCDNFCSYCIVPYVRGRERSRKPEDILAEIRKLVSEGVVEIMLLGQNVNSYGKNLDSPVTFAALLRQIDELDGLRRIRFMTSHPKDLSEELIEVMRDSKHVCRHLHLPVQSGSSRVLKAMNRGYTKEQYLELVDKVKSAMPDLSFTTDIIVGFPGETQEDFLETLEVVRQVRFDSAFTFLYSKREGTRAASMQDATPKEVVKERFDRLLKEVQAISAQVCARDLHKTLDVLVEGADEHLQGYVTGRLDNNTLVHFPGEASLVGTLVPVYLEESKGFYYMGRMG